MIIGIIWSNLGNKCVTTWCDEPSRSSRLAPPPVLTWLTLSSVPYLAAHVAVSPPPGVDSRRMWNMSKRPVLLCVFFWGFFSLLINPYLLGLRFSTNSANNVYAYVNCMVFSILLCVTEFKLFVKCIYILCHLYCILYHAMCNKI